MFLLKLLFKDVKCKLEDEGETAEFTSRIGVKQGDLLGPVLFNYHMAAVMMVWRARYKAGGGVPCRFRTAYDSQLTGRKRTRCRGAGCRWRSASGT